MNPNEVIRLKTGPRRMRGALAFCFIVLSIFYFFPTTRDKGSIVKEDESSISPIQSVTQSKQKWYDYFRVEKQRTYYYFGRRMKLLQSRTTHHLDKSIIEQVFAKNRINMFYTANK